MKPNNSDAELSIEGAPKAGNEDSIPVPNVSTAAPNADIPPPPGNSEPVIEPDAVLSGDRRNRRQRGNKPPPPPPEPPPQPLGEEQINNMAVALGLTAKVIFLFIAAQRGEHWKLTADDQNVLGQTWATALAPYMAASAKYVPIALAVLGTASVLQPRLEKDAQIATEKQQAEGATLPQPDRKAP